ncbi:aldose 1-epimerase family protein [Arthrobacter sp. NyZ413]|uniref:aldose 1-epimerase family protein n=1 Tax=Arthrobacter sp. NyZ413 TaxID=3144669 RepID=UPI003BF87263
MNAGEFNPLGEHAISASGYTAVITESGAAVRSLTFNRRDLIVPFAQGESMPDYRGALVAPWPNRIPDGRYRFRGVDLQVPINEPARGAALHGLVSHSPWTLLYREDASLCLRYHLQPSRGYPFSVLLHVKYWIDEVGFHTAVVATNTGSHAAPYGVCPHPYLVAGPSPLSDWILELNAGSFLDVTPDRLIPIRRVPVAGSAFDFRTPRPLGEVRIDNAFTELEFGPDGRAHLRLTDPSGTGVAMSWDAACGWVQLHTADHHIPERHRLGLAAEPMSCPPNAFNSEENLVLLPPGDVHEAAWSIHGIGGHQGSGV